MADFGLIKSFDIDDGQLDAYEKSQCFVLGYELAKIDAMLEQPGAIEQPFQRQNIERVEKSLFDSGRDGTIEWAGGDDRKDWLMLKVKPL